MATNRWEDHLPFGDHASRPAAGDVPVGSLYACSDHTIVYITDGSTWSNWHDPTGLTGGGGVTELDYTEITSSVSITATSEATADTVMTATGVAVDGSTEIEVEVYAPWIRPDNTAANRNLSVYLFEDGVSLGLIALVTSPAAANAHSPMLAKRRITPASGTQVYTVRARVNAGTGSFGAGPGGVGENVPAYIRITEV